MVIVDDLNLNIDDEFEIECSVIDEEYLLDLMNVPETDDDDVDDDDVRTLLFFSIATSALPNIFLSLCI